MTSAAILAGGAARRLDGRRKEALEVGGRTILARQLEVLQAAGITHVVSIGRTAIADVETVPALADAVADAGALGGLYTAVLTAPTDRVLVLACDLPFLTARFVARLCELGTDADAVVPRTATGWHPLAAVYHRRIAGRVKARIDRRALRITDALDELTVQPVGPEDVARFDPDGMLLTNVNTPDDYQRACQQANARDNDSARL